MQCSICIARDGSGLLVQSGFPDTQTERMLDVYERLTVFERDKVVILPDSVDVLALWAVVRVRRVVSDSLAPCMTIRPRVIDRIVQLTLCVLLPFTEYVGLPKAPRVTSCTAQAAASRSVPGRASGHVPLDGLAGRGGK